MDMGYEFLSLTGEESYDTVRCTFVCSWCSDCVRTCLDPPPSRSLSCADIHVLHGLISTRTHTWNILPCLLLVCPCTYADARTTLHFCTQTDKSLGIMRRTRLLAGRLKDKIELWNDGWNLPNYYMKLLFIVSRCSRVAYCIQPLDAVCDSCISPNSLAGMRSILSHALEFCPQPRHGST